MTNIGGLKAKKGSVPLTRNISMLEIRKPSISEKLNWLPLWHGYLTFYETQLPDEITDLTWRRLHDDSEPLNILAAYDADRMIGIVHYQFHRSTGARNTYCYLEDLFVSPQTRSKGTGRRLIEAVRQVAQEAGASRLYWTTHESNATARALYDRLATRSDFIQYRMPLE